MTRVCSELCTRLKTVLPKGGKLPSHEALLAHLCFSIEDRKKGRFLGTWNELQERTHCNFCTLVVAAISHTIQFSNRDAPAHNQEIRVLVYPGEQSFRLSYPTQSGLCLPFIAESALQAGGPDTARALPEKSNQILQIRQWIDKCDTEHEDCLSPKPGPGFEKRHGVLKIKFPETATSNFRVLDLELGCIVPVALDVKYVALSYVWGQAPMLRLAMGDFQHMSTPGSLATIRDRLSRTVNDAIELVAALKERYIWIDGLCLVQDDEDDVALGIEMMNSIYHGSYFTIVAASGDDASAGLSGVNHDACNTHKTHQAQIVQTISPHLRMTYVHSINWHLNRSTYNKRGWTLQELVLPRRTIVFLDNQVYFRCYEANWRSDMWSDHWSHWLDADDGNISRIPDPNDGFMPSCWEYQNISEEYSRRKLRKDGDALRAIAGVTRPLAAGMETILLEGIPAYFLDHYLLFIASNGDLRRRQDFASFSWAGWEGHITWPRDNFTWFDEQSARTWETANILQHFKHHRLISWRSLHQTGKTEDLATNYDEPSPLQKLMKEHATVFPETNENPERKYQYPWFHGGSSSGCDIPCWDRPPSTAKLWNSCNEDEIDPIKRRLRHRKAFSPKGLDLANGQAELDRLLERFERLEDMPPLFTYAAMVSGRGQDADRTRTSVGPRPISEQAKEGHYSFRYSRDAYDGTKEIKSDHENQPQPLDERVRMGKFWQEKYANDPDSLKSKKPPSKIPTFPPYPILQGLTISLYLNLGARTGSSATPKPEPTATIPRESYPRFGYRSEDIHGRIPGIPLLSATNEIVGSIHPDNIKLPESSIPGSKLELMIIARSKTPTNGSALFELDCASSYANKPWDLLWVMHVIWKEGIAERRGVGQILASALDCAVDPQPCLKTLLFG